MAAGVTNLVSEPQLAEDYPNGMGMMRVYAASSPHVEFVGGEAAVNASANAAVYIDVEGQEAAHILTINVVSLCLIDNVWLTKTV